MSLSTLGPTISPTGISAPTYAEILQQLQDDFHSIFGSDAYIEPDSQDGQLLAVMAQAIHDCNQQIIAVYQSFSPTFAQGVGLSSLVKINGLRRLIPTNSTADGLVVGVAGTIINNGSVRDANGNIWTLPTTVVIPGGGEIEVTVTAQQAGAITAPLGTINQIASPTLGWQSFVSTTDAVAGAPLETDAALRARQAASTALPSVTPLAGLISALANLTGVTRVAVYENDTNGPDSNGLVAHSIAVVIEGGTDVDIATTIGQKKTPGAATNGSTTVAYVDPITGIHYNINFYHLAYTPITVEISLDALTGWNSNIESEIQTTIGAYVNGLGIGQAVQISRMWLPAYLNGSAPDNQQYHITSLTINLGGVDVPIAFDHAAQMLDSSTAVVITINP